MTRLSVLWVVVCVAACGGMQRDSETLGDSIREYNEGIRWQRFATAANAIPPKQRSEFADAMDARAEQLHITDYEIVRVENKGPKVAKVQVKVSWYRDAEGRLNETHAVQTWERKGKDWWMVEEIRLRGVEMPGLTEPAEPAEPAEPVDKPAADPPAKAPAEAIGTPPYGEPVTAALPMVETVR